MPRDRTTWDFDMITPEAIQRQAQMIQDIEEIRRRTPPPAPTQITGAFWDDARRVVRAVPAPTPIYRNHGLFEATIEEPVLQDLGEPRMYVRYGEIAREPDSPPISKSDYQYGDNFS